jgi:hypothetical protein
MNLGPFKLLYYEWKVNGGDGIPFIKHILNDDGWTSSMKS